ncbi:MAG: cyclomaltodextrinase N-terminal domain-containing protein [Saprospiraceae bacterium]|nr:cyclomaltodextrinase N-terminal domain-containing protein [Saprospiraceae bacterium]
MNRPYLLAFCFAIFSLLACKAPAQQGNIYDNNPEQRLPIGTEKVKHRHIPATGGKVDKVRVEPPFWFTGMARPELEVLIYDQNIKDYEVSLTNAEGVKLVQVYRVENPNYLFVELEIGPGAKPGKFNIVLKKGSNTKTYPYELRQKNSAFSSAPNPQSAIRNPQLNASDFIYLIMPDRFANGDPTNDSYPDMTQVGVNRQKMYFRHGGDLQGVMNHLDYFTELGVTALWLNPVMENNQPYESYHGYAVTDFYNIDKRFGSNELYNKLVDDCHASGIKVIMDIIFNHCGNQAWFIHDLPSRRLDSPMGGTYQARLSGHHQPRPLPSRLGQGTGEQRLVRQPHARPQPAAPPPCQLPHPEHHLVDGLLWAGCLSN